MNDPREVLTTDPYDNVSSDEQDEEAILRDLENVERKRQDLLNRIKEKQESKKLLDPNFQQLQVPCSPVKKTETNVPVAMKKSTNEMEIPHENPNELRIREKSGQLPSNTTTYFMEKFQKSKKEEEGKIQKMENMMNARVHTFQDQGGKQEFKPIQVNEIEEYSNIWLKKRYIPQSELRKMLHNIKILRLSKLFAKVRPPKFSEPQYSNWAALGIISAKGDAKFTTTDKPKKYLKFTMTDFQHKLDVYIFGKGGVERYYNLRVGDVIAILNPEVFPWRPSGKGQFIKSFNLRINHDFKCILEIGSSKDLGFCKVTSRNGTLCNTPINMSKEDRCDYHQEIRFRDNNSKRIELNGSFALGAPTKVENNPTLYRKKNGETRHSRKNRQNFSVSAS